MSIVGIKTIVPVHYGDAALPVLEEALPVDAPRPLLNSEVPNLLRNWTVRTPAFDALANKAPVPAFEDVSPNAAHMTAAGGASQGVKVVNQGQNYLYLNGLTNRYGFADISDNTYSRLTIYVVAIPLFNTDYGVILAGADLNCPAYFINGRLGGSPVNEEAFASYGSGTDLFGATGGYTAGRKYIFTFQHTRINAETRRIFRNETQAASYVNPATFDPLPPLNLMGFVYPAGTYNFPFRGLVQQIVIAASLHDAATMTSIRGTLKAGWGVDY